MRLIDADRLIESVEIGRDGDDELASIFSSSDIIGRIESQPTVDAVPVVRCKDCIHYRPNTDGEADEWCYHFGYETDEEDFCSYGEGLERSEYE